jgi:hypothetical protein
MLVFAENKRRVLAGFAAVVVLVATGFTLGRSIGSSSSTAQAAATTPATSVVTSLHRQLAAARSAALTASAQLARERTQNAKLTTTVSHANSRLAAVGRCQRVKPPKPIRHCVEGALR